MKYVVFVDAYSSANQYAPLCKERGLHCLHVHSRQDIPQVYLKSFRAQDFDLELTFAANIETIAEKLKSFSPIAVICGTESGVEITDKLSSMLKLPGNGIEYSPHRRDKYLMAQRLAECNVRTIEQQTFDNLEKIIQWKDEKRLDRIVLKPRASAGGDSVYFCQTKEDLEKAFNRIINTENKLGLLNQAVLAQEFVSGTEYIVNSVSHQGQSIFTEFVRYQKQMVGEGVRIYDQDWFLHEDEPEIEILKQYSLKVLKSLGIEQGPAHAEVIIDEKGPVLVEIASRIDGGVDRDHNLLCTRFNQVDLTLDAYLDPQVFSLEDTDYQLKKPTVIMHMISHQEGLVKSIEGEEKIKSLKSYFSHSLRYKIGQLIEPTNNIFTSPGFIYMAHDERTQIERDIAFIRNLEKENSFFTT